jgi:hypothetical protein
MRHGKGSAQVQGHDCKTENRTGSNLGQETHDKISSPVMYSYTLVLRKPPAWNSKYPSVCAIGPVKSRYRDGIDNTMDESGGNRVARELRVFSI